MWPAGNEGGVIVRLRDRVGVPHLWGIACREMVQLGGVGGVGVLLGVCRAGHEWRGRLVKRGHGRAPTGVDGLVGRGSRGRRGVVGRGRLGSEGQ